ncbi:MAG: chromosomal replication initiator protein DnaA, partial [Oscillospiraceae bacterium]|jgi:chromosomal replication initiator protein|nr:chromosomal replication initiator protein DnaA [Oscillospiraceae bacterium]
VIVKKKADSIGLHLPDDVVDYFVRTLKNNIRQLEGVVNQLQAMVEFRGLSVNLATAQQAANDLLSEERPVSVTVERVIEETARNYQLTISELRSKRRSAEISRARQVAMYVISQTTGLPTKAIGNEFDRDHSTVVYALREIREALAYDSSLRKAVQEITKAAQEN